MNRDEFLALFDAAANDDMANRDAMVAAMTATARIRSWCDARDLAQVSGLHALGTNAEHAFGFHTRCNPRDAERVVERSKTAEAAPVFADALADGKVAGAHLDQLTVSLRRADDEVKKALLADAKRLVKIAEHSTPDEFARTLRAEERRLRDDDGMAQLQKQRAAVRLQERVDLVTGMHHFHLTLDPLEGLKLHNKIAAATEALFHDTTPEHCPTDRYEKQAFLRVHALLQILEGKGIRLGKPEIVAVVDTTVADTATGSPVIDWGLPIEIPERVLHDLFNAGQADVHTVVVRNGVVLHAPGELNLGRTTRLANRAQRRALRATYASCAIPGCAARFDNCDLHHVVWWRNGGRTDLDNLIPVCSKHHHLIHEGGWQLHLTPDRTLTITYPDGTTMKTGPPRRQAA